MMFIISMSFAQEDVVNKAAQMLQSKDYNGAIPLLDQASTNPKTSGLATTWYYRSFAYKDRFNATKSVADRLETIKSINKVYELDTKKEYTATCNQLMIIMATSIYNEGVAEMNKQDYEKAKNHFVEYQDLISKVSPEKINDELVFFTGYNAYMAGDMELAVSKLEEVRAKNYNDALVYELLGKEYWKAGNKDKSIEVLEDGSSKHPRNKDIILLEIDYLLKMGNTSKATDKLDKAIMLDPTNIDIKVLQAQLYEMQAKFDSNKKQELTDKAKEGYKRVIAQNPNHFKANYNQGLLYYNEGVNKMNNMDEDDDDLFALMEIQDECINLFKDALPLMEKCQQLQPQNKDVLVALSGIYFALNYAEKGNQVQEQISALEQKGK